MRALVLYGPGNYGFSDDYPKPEVKPGWARVKVAYSGICGSDLPRFAEKGSYHHPMILGHEFSGTVDQPAPNSKNFKGGERVAVLPIIPCGECSGCRTYGPFHCKHYQFLGSRNDGGFAEYCLVPEENLFCLPEETDLVNGAFIEPALVGLHVIRNAGFKPGQKVLVTGSGTIGLMIAMWLKEFSASYICITDVREESLRVAEKIGIDSAVNVSKEKPPTDSGFDVAFEASGSFDALKTCIESVRSKGKITVVGRSENDLIFSASLFESFMRKEKTIQGCWGYEINGEEGLLKKKFEEDKFPLKHLITKTVSLEQSPEIISSMIKREFFYCKVLIKIGDN